MTTCEPRAPLALGCSHYSAESQPANPASAFTYADLAAASGEPAPQPLTRALS